jgi:hypothetical protein
MPLAPNPLGQRVRFLLGIEDAEFHLGEVATERLKLAMNTPPGQC